eukprot:scaffold2182_cov118-Isochrysis_galbana.AAC.11
MPLSPPPLLFIYFFRFFGALYGLHKKICSFELFTLQHSRVCTTPRPVEGLRRDQLSFPPTSRHARKQRELRPGGLVPADGRRRVPRSALVHLQQGRRFFPHRPRAGGPLRQRANIGHAQANRALRPCQTQGPAPVRPRSPRGGQGYTQPIHQQRPATSSSLETGL